MFENNYKLIWFVIFYNTKDEPNLRRWTYVRAENTREAEKVARSKLKERNTDFLDILEIKKL